MQSMKAKESILERQISEKTQRMEDLLEVRNQQVCFIMYVYMYVHIHTHTHTHSRIRTHT